MFSYPIRFLLDPLKFCLDPHPLIFNELTLFESTYFQRAFFDKLAFHCYKKKLTSKKTKARFFTYRRPQLLISLGIYILIAAGGTIERTNLWLHPPTHRAYAPLC